MVYRLYTYIFNLFPPKENGIPHAITATKKEKEVDSEPLFQQNNLKLQRNMEEHKLKVFDYLHLL